MVRLRSPAPVIFGGSAAELSRTSYGSVPEWPKGTDCKSAGNAFGGPNPPAPTTKKHPPCGGCFFVSVRWPFGTPRGQKVACNLPRKSKTWRNESPRSGVTRSGGMPLWRVLFCVGAVALRDTAWSEGCLQPSAQVEDLAQRIAAKRRHPLRRTPLWRVLFCVGADVRRRFMALTFACVCVTITAVGTPSIRR